MDPRFTQQTGVGVYTGNELIVKGALEAGVSLITGYPGSPVAEVFETVHANADLFLEHGILAQIANNEALAAARLNGSQMRGMRAMMVMKCVGVHVAADALAIGNLAGPHKDGGVLIVMGDDPWSEGTQVPADSRFISQHLMIPVLEPGGYQEIKDWIRIGFELSNASRCYIGYLLTSSQADGGGTIQPYANVYSDVTVTHPTELEPRDINTADRVIIPPDTVRKETELLHDRFPALHAAVRKQNINRICDPAKDGRAPLGLVSSGVSALYLEHALEILGLRGAMPILKLGMVYPIDPEIIREFAGQVDSIIVVEQKRDFIESHISKIIGDHYQNGRLDTLPPVWGKQLPGGLPGIPSEHGLNASVILERLVPVFLAMDPLPAGADRARMQEEYDLIRETAGYDVTIPSRSPSFCPGCPHRDSASVINEINTDFTDAAYMQRKHRRGPVKLIFHGDIGCYSMLKYAPFNALMHNLSGMGLGGGAGAGIDPFITNKQVVFVGDSTFFHSGLVAISDSVKNRQDITYMILDNKTTAMTGHQPTPGTDQDILGQPTFAQQIDDVARGLADMEHIHVIRTDPGDRNRYRNMLEEVFLMDGVKVVVADKECGITFHRQKKRDDAATIRTRGYLPEKRVVHVTPEVCEFCLECTNRTGCTALKFVETPYGRKVATDDSLCVADGACMKTMQCPAFEEITIHRKQPPAVDDGHALSTPTGLPEPDRRQRDDGMWGGYIAGVGGMGIGVVAAILARAGELEGYQVQFANKKGLAIRNGGVYAHVLYGPQDRRLSPTILYGHADLLLGLDILEAVRGLDPKINLRIGSPRHTTAIVNTSKTPTVSTLLGREDFHPDDLMDILARYTKADALIGIDAVAVAEDYLGNKLFANLILLGAAFQQGAIPVSLDNLTTAIQRTVGDRQMEKNLLAFQMGRQMTLDRRFYHQPDAPETGATIIEDTAQQIAVDIGVRRAKQYRVLADQALQEFALDDRDRGAFARRIGDLLVWQDRAYAERYIRQVLRVQAGDSAGHGWAATRAVLWNLHKVMLIKDEIYVAHLLTSRSKEIADQRHYNIHPERGDRLVYRHYNRPAFDLFGRRIEFNIVTRNWQLRMVKHCRFLRRLLPQWHRKEKDFRDWYESLIAQWAWTDEVSYETWVRIFETPEEVRGYRDIRYPKMDAARENVAQRLTNLENGRATLSAVPGALASIPQA